ncbi:CehA/McbA family metallohydrolase [Chloroflexota bacterium]
MHELVVNLHMHTTYSDGTLSHAEIAGAALGAGLDVVIVTDHNVYVHGLEDYYEDDEHKVLLLIGEEIHDQARQPQKNHLLVVGANQELAHLAWNTPKLLESVRQAGGASFLAHPVDPASPAVNEADLSWEDWDIQGFTGIELWNAMSEFKSLIKSKLHAIFYAYNPERIARGPFKKVLRKWDDLLVSGQRVVAIGGSDAHAMKASMGPLQRTLFPFEFHFRTVNTHILTQNALTDDIEHDRSMVLEALAQGRAFIGYDLPAPTRGFRFNAHGLDSKATMGEEIPSKNGVTFQIKLPKAAECLLIKDGEIIQSWEKRENCTHITTEPGVYRVEVYTNYLGKRRGWIFSNPIYVREN